MIEKDQKRRVRKAVEAATAEEMPLYTEVPAVE